jgi:ferredoxin/flavodoxin
MNSIYWFSATGNSLAAARRIAEETGAVTINMARTSPNSVGYDDADAIGFVFPCFAGTLPRMVRDFAESVILPPDAYIFAVVTCGGEAGSSIADFAALLQSRGAKLCYGAEIVTVDNYIVFSGAVIEPERGITQADRAITRICANIKARHVDDLSSLATGRGAPDFSACDRDFVVSDRCTSCGLCVNICPRRNIILENDRPVFRHNCEHCLACLHWCPSSAIDYKTATQGKPRYHHPAAASDDFM